MARDEDRLGELLRLAPPPNEGVAFEEVVRTVRHRRALRASVLGAVAATALVAAGAVVVLQDRGTPDTLATDGDVDLTGAVPWTDAPLQPYVGPTSTATTPPSDARPCTLSDVSAAFDGGDGATGHLFAYVVFRNTSTSTCVLKGYPDVVATDPGRPDVVADHSTYFSDVEPANMAPGGKTSLAVETDSLCAARPGGGGGLAPYHRLDITLPSGGKMWLPSPNGLDITCGLHITPFYVEQEPAPQPHDPLSDLQAALELPSSVAAGTTLVYAVDLTNPTDQPIAFDRCPSYLEPAPGIKAGGQLNCAAAAPIGPGQIERFEMRLKIPDSVPAGPLALTWELAGPLDVRAQGSVQVVS